VEEAGLGPKRRLIGRAVDMVIYMQKTADNRRIVSSISSVRRYNQQSDSYETEIIYETA
jgi:type IV secretion system protein VirB11